MFFLILQQRQNFIIFFFNDTATTEIYTLSLHDALPIFHGRMVEVGGGWWRLWGFAPPEPPVPTEPPPTCSTTTEAIVLGGTVGSRTARPESRSMGSGFPSASRYARSGCSFTPVS